MHTRKGKATLHLRLRQHLDWWLSWLRYLSLAANIEWRSTRIDTPHPRTQSVQEPRTRHQVSNARRASKWVHSRSTLLVCLLYIIKVNTEHCTGYTQVSSTQSIDCPRLCLKYDELCEVRRRSLTKPSIRCITRHECETHVAHWSAHLSIDNGQFAFKQIKFG